MKHYSNKISLTKNIRGMYFIDPIMGCHSGMVNCEGGCYGDCYAAKSARIYGYDYTKSVLRNFRNQAHTKQLLHMISKIPLPFVRMGGSGDPSENWSHTLEICAKIHRGINTMQVDIFGEIQKPKEIVIITKHWNNLTDNQLKELQVFNVCVNTSVSAIDCQEKLKNRLLQYEKLKKYCRSVLRVVTFDFNLQNKDGLLYSKIQDNLIKNRVFINTVFRPSKNNPLLINGVINARKETFMKSKTLISLYDKKTYRGMCGTCPEMCGVNIN
jgi:hypothetical protein